MSDAVWERRVRIRADGMRTAYGSVMASQAKACRPEVDWHAPCVISPFVDSTTTRHHRPEHMSDTPDTPAIPGEPAFKDGAVSFGAFYPKNYLLAVFADVPTARTAADHVLGEGFSADEVIVASGADVLAHERDVEAEKGLFAKIGEQLSKLYTDESADAKTLLRLAAQGAAFVLVYAPEDDQTTRAAAILRNSRPSVMRKYGTLAIAELS